jgi:hypothetical protein
MVRNKDCECMKCGWKWLSRVENPSRCPKCRLYNWGQPKIRNIKNKQPINMEETKPQEEKRSRFI